MITTDKKQLVQESLRTLAEAHSETVRQLEQTIKVLSGVLEIEAVTVIARSPASGRSHRTTHQDIPLADPATLSIIWQGRSCFLGNTLLFWFFERLSRSPNQYISHIDLLEDVWQAQREASTIRGVAKRLRDRLTAAGMREVADAIDGGVPGYYCLNLV